MAPTNKRKIIEKGPPGRPKHEVWALGFRRVLKHCEKTHRTIHAAFCVICSKVLCNTASKRLTAHRRICSLEQSEDAESKDKEITKIITDNSNTITFVDMEDVQYISSEQSSSDQIAKTEYTFIDNPTESFEDFKISTINNVDNKLDLIQAKLFIGCNINFSVADSTYFKKLCLTLNPNCKLITSEQLSGPLLDHIYSKFYKDIEISPTSVLLVDGWKNESTNTKNVTVIIKTENGENIFLDNYELTNNKEIVQELSDIIKIAIVEAYEQFKTEIYAVILGNSFSLITIDSEVWQFSCSSQIINLLVKEHIPQDFMNTICKVLKQINVLFKDDDIEAKISGDMRWIHIKYILQYCITNLGSIQEVLSSDDLVKLPKEDKCLLFDEEFIHKIEYFINFLESISELTTVCQMSKSNLADTIEQWLSIPLPEDDPELTEKLLSKREIVMKIQCLVANYLHPSYRGKKLSDDQMNKVEEFLLTELDAEGLNSLQSYVNGDSIFRVLNQKEGLTAQTYWSLARRTHNDLATLALKLLSVPASISSNCSQIFNTLKNTSLKPDKLRKLFAVYYCLKNQPSINVVSNKILCNTGGKKSSPQKRNSSLDQNNESELIEKPDCDSKEKEITKILTTDNTATITFLDMDGNQYISEQSPSDHITKTEYEFLDESEETFDDIKLSVTGSSINDSKFEIILAKFFVGCNIPFSVADSLYFKKFCLTLNPTCKLVTSEQLAGPLLDTVYSKFHKNVQVSQTSVLLIDGWKNESTNTKNVTIMIKTETNETIFLDNYELSNNKDIVQELAEITKMAMAEAYEQFKTAAYAVILGNNCTSITMDNVTELWQLPCNLHVIKLLIKEHISQDLMNTICRILKQVNDVFKDDDLEIRMSVDMRWTHIKYILQYCITNLGSIQEVLSSSDLKLLKEHKCLFFNQDFINKIEAHINFLELINELIMVCQMPKSNIADSTEQWLSIPLPEDDQELAEKLLEKRNNVIKIQCLVANYLSPLYKGRKLSEDQMNKVEEFLLNELDAEGLNSLQSYVNGHSIFRVLNEKEGLTAQTYWSLARRTHNDLATLALKLVTIPASINSNFSQIFNNIKNISLKPDRIRKLFAVYYHLKERDEKLEIE